MSSIDDEKYMRRAIHLAKLGELNASPNPMVGAVVVHEGKIIGEGYHRKCGTAHAEVNAINSVADKTLLAESTIYVTLEPCSHFGKTPPCCDLIIAKKLKKVVVGMVDPFSKVSGRGISKIKEAGIDVEVGVLEKECRELNKKFIKAHTEKRPYVLLKWAQTADGYMGKLENDRPAPLFVSTPLTRLIVHRERACYDAIMVGAGTVNSDNPSLSVRYYAGNNPLRVILSAGMHISADSRIFKDGIKTVIYTLADSKTIESNNVEYVTISDRETAVDEILADLYSRNVISLMVEGGLEILKEFISKDIWDEVRIEKNTECAGSGIKAPKVSGILNNVENHAQNKIYHIFRS